MAVVQYIYTHRQYTEQHNIENTDNNRTTQITTNWEECWPCPVFASFTLAFALQLRKEHGKTSVRVAEECQYTYYQTHTLQNPHIHMHTYITKPTLNKTHTHTHTHITKQITTTTVQDIQVETTTVQDIHSFIH